MSWLSEKRGYDRARVLAGARRAAKHGDHTKAIDLYTRVQRIEPENTDILRRIAGQRARAGQREEAWRDCQAAAGRLEKAGFAEQAIGVLRDFAAHLPDTTEVWEALSDLELSRERGPDAVDVLIEGRQHFRSRRARPEALVLLRRARRIDPTHFAANFDLAGLLARCGNRSQARRILENLDRHARGRDLRRLRGRLFRLSPGPRRAWRWLEAVVRRT